MTVLTKEQMPAKNCRFHW